MFWNKEAETIGREDLLQIQLDRFKETLALVYDNVPFYKKTYDDAGIDISSITSLEAIRELPFTVKYDLRDNYPYGLFAVPLDDVVRLHVSSGTTGKPTVVGYTQNDIDTWIEMMSRALMAAGCDHTSVVQNAHGYGLFTGGLGMHYGSENIGATTIPSSTGNTAKQLMLMEDLGTTFMGATPSYAIYLGDELQKRGIDLNRLKLKSGVFGGEPWTEEMRQQIQAKLGIKAHNLYGLSEMYGPSVGIECEEQNGLHIWEDLFFIEIIDPDTLEPVPDGQYGELVLTSLKKEAMPLVRYRTRDITRILPEPCPCGRTHRRIERLRGRTDDMLIIKGVNVFPSQIEEALLRCEGISPHYLITVRRVNSLDSIEVACELDTTMSIDDLREINRLRDRVAAEIQSVTGIKVAISLREPHSLPRTEGKSKRVIDERSFE